MSAADVVPLAEAGDEARFGGKAAQLAVALGNGLPVPDGMALAWDFVDRVASGDRDAGERCGAIAAELRDARCRRSAQSARSARRQLCRPAFDAPRCALGEGCRTRSSRSGSRAAPKVHWRTGGCSA